MSRGAHAPADADPLPARVYRLGADLSVWQALYAVGLGAMLEQLAGLGWWPGVWETLTLALGAHGLFLLDRAKTSDRLLDPADTAADPRRDAFIREHALGVRLACAASLVAGVSIAIALVSWIAAVVIAAGVVGVLAYSGRPPGPSGPNRLKDVPVAKNLFVAVGLTLLCLAVVLPDPLAPPGFAWEIAAVGALVVAGDAVLCDLDDAVSDREFGVGSLAGVLGQAPAAWIGAILLVLAGLLVLSPLTRANWGVRGIWAGGLAATSAAVLALRRGKTKSIVDLRLLVLALLALVPAS